MSEISPSGERQINGPTPKTENLHSAFIRTLGQMLMPDETGVIRFGADAEALRLSQAEALTAFRDTVTEGRTTGSIVQPGGTGKTREGIFAAEAMHRAGRSSLYVVPSQQAVNDFSSKARVLCPDLDVGTVYEVEKHIGRLTFITYASLLRCVLGESAEAEAHDFEEAEAEMYSEPSPSANGTAIVIDPSDYGLVVWDEAHKYLTVNAQKLLQRFAQSINLGLTATPRYYEGKEVAHVFGSTIHELDLQTAIQRKEISDFRNILITTDVTTGLRLTTPDQEEGEQVARAIDRGDRNGIFPDIYRHFTVQVRGKRYAIAGEPAIVFGASITHVHDLAKAFNDALTPVLREDGFFRALLLSKGIDPDTVEQIAAPIHSGGTDNHTSMDLHARNQLVERYNARKVLVLVATSVLQQSFDSPITSVIVDTVPRQTFVGVGQAGMRSLRYLENKDMAFIFNTQDADHSSLTFADFHAARGHEDGVIVEITGRAGATFEQSKTTHSENSGEPGKYSITCGRSLAKLAKKRREERNRLHREDYLVSSRYFTDVGYQRVNQLLLDIGSGKQESVNEFVETIFSWMQKVTTYIASNVFGFRDDEADGVAVDVLMHQLALTRAGRMENWSRFSQRFYQQLHNRCMGIQRNREKRRTLNLYKNVPHRHVQSHLREEKPEEIAMLNEPTRVQLHETIASGEGYSVQQALIDRQSAIVTDDVTSMLDLLEERERIILEMRYGLRDGTTYSYEHIGLLLGITRERVRQVQKKTMNKIRAAAYQHANSSAKENFATIANGLAQTKLAQKLAELKQQHWSECALKIIDQQQILKENLGGIFPGHVSIAPIRIQLESGIPHTYIIALTQRKSNIKEIAEAVHSMPLAEWSTKLSVLPLRKGGLQRCVNAIRTLKLIVDDLKDRQQQLMLLSSEA